MSDRSVSRRQFVAGSLSLAALAASGEAFAAAAKPPYGMFRMGIQSYSLRGFKVEDALKKTQALGLKFWEAYPEHIGITDDPKKIAETKEMLKHYDVALKAYGVVDFHNDEKDARRKFDFAKAMGIETLSAYPSYDSFDLLDKLTTEYKINIAIHNHGPGDNLYDKIEKSVAKFKGHNVRVGSCDDTGHYLNSSEDPVAAARTFGKRVHGVHLKDVKTLPDGKKEFVELGKGDLKLDDMFKTLKSIGFKGILSLEYEDHADNPIPYIEECLTVVREKLK